MLWGAPLPDNVARPDALQPLLERALVAAPDSSAVHAKLGHLHYDRHDYASAAASFEMALRLDPVAPGLRRLLARCLNYLHRYEDALAAAADAPEAGFERGRALMELGRAGAAEREFRSVLAGSPDDVGACRMLFRLLRGEDRLPELVALCEELASRGASNAQLLYNWGWALALAGDRERARRLMFDPERVAAIELAAPRGFPGIAAFNRALADEILGNPHKVSEFATEDEANRGSRRVDNLFTGRRPELIALLLEQLQNAVASWCPEPEDGFDPWPRARPNSARLRPWGLIQRDEEYEEGHIHPGGWLSGVYYVRVPAAVAEAPEPGPGCIEFGPPSAIAGAFPDLAPPRRYRPREGLLLLSPSHFQHRTIPSGVGGHRISVAFDVVPGN